MPQFFIDFGYLEAFFQVPRGGGRGLSFGLDVVEDLGEVIGRRHGLVRGWYRLGRQLLPVALYEELVILYLRVSNMVSVIHVCGVRSHDRRHAVMGMSRRDGDKKSASRHVRRHARRHASRHASRHARGPQDSPGARPGSPDASADCGRVGRAAAIAWCSNYILNKR